MDFLDFKRLDKELDMRTLTFSFPVTELGIDGETNAEVIVEYLRDRNNPENPNQFVVNVWLMETNFNMKLSVMTFYLPTEENEEAIKQAVRIISAVSKKKNLREKLSKGIIHLRESSSKYPWLLEGRPTENEPSLLFI